MQDTGTRGNGQRDASSQHDASLFLRRVLYSQGTSPELGQQRRFPFSLPVLSNLNLGFTRPVTFLVGENGTGKSTILESLAIATRCIAMGSSDLDRDATLVPAQRLAKQLRLVRGKKPQTSMFFRAEDAFGFIRRVQAESETLTALEHEFRNSFEDGSLAQTLATGVVSGQRQAFSRRYGENPDAASHGESFLHLLEERLVPNGLFLLDEPETPLSPLRILALLRILLDRVDNGCQFIIATHSPMLMAFPGADILSFQEETIKRTTYNEVEHVTLTKAFLANPDAFLRRLTD